MNKQKNTQVKSKTSIRKAGTGVAYTQADLKYIEENIATVKLTEMAIHLNRTFESVRYKVDKMGLSENRIYSFKPYTADDVAFLIENAPKYTTKELVVLTGRTFDSIEKKLRMLKIKPPNERGFTRITEEDVAFIKKNHKKLTISQLAEKLKKHNVTIIKKLEKLGLRVPQRRAKKVV